MYIVVDIGNTSIKFGFVQDEKILESFTLPSAVNLHTIDSIALQLITMLQCSGFTRDDVEDFYVSSVVPSYDNQFKEMGKKFFNCEVYVVGKDIIVPLENCYDNPKEVGADRLVGAYAARVLNPEMESIISIDYGTATTFDCVEGNKYLGGLICPGVLSSHAALSEKAAKLPRIALEVEEGGAQIGKNTALSISHGFVYGFSAMTEGLLKNLSGVFPQKPYVVATGGFASDIAKHVSSINTVEPNLILIGLALLKTNKSN